MQKYKAIKLILFLISIITLVVTAYVFLRTVQECPYYCEPGFGICHQDCNAPRSYMLTYIWAAISALAWFSLIAKDIKNYWEQQSAKEDTKENKKRERVKMIIRMGSFILVSVVLYLVVLYVITEYSNIFY